MVWKRSWVRLKIPNNNKTSLWRDKPVFLRHIKSLFWDKRIGNTKAISLNHTLSVFKITHCYLKPIKNFRNSVEEWIKKFIWLSTGCVGEVPPPYIDYSTNIIPSTVSVYTAKQTQGNVGESRDFTCPPGTVAEGNKRIKCLANGQWETPRCQGLSIIYFFLGGKGVNLDRSMSNCIPCFLDTCRL